jgi:NAD(P)-dependent dehydrogenase (short-subunit alcohol dehydrogenase family)
LGLHDTVAAHLLVLLEGEFLNDLPVFAPNLLDGKLALITGGGTGIGFATARELGSLGARVILAARDFERLEKAAGVLEAEGIEAHVHAVNIRDEKQVEALFEAVVEQHGLPDILVNNSGGQFEAPAVKISANGFRSVVDLNLNGTWHMTSAFGRRLLEAGKPGDIVNIAIVVNNGAPGYAHAAAARAGVINLTKTLAREWGKFGIRINAIAGGTIDTPGLEQYDRAALDAAIKKLPIERAGTAREMALAVVYLVSPAGAYTTGSTLDVDGGEHMGGAW